jgi:subtilisin family serine protease
MKPSQQNFFKSVVFGFWALLSPQFLKAQMLQELHLISGTQATASDFQSRRLETLNAATDVFQGNYYRLIQFEKMPSLEDKESMRLLGLGILDYIPYNAFIVSIPQNFDCAQLTRFSPRTWRRLSGADKMSTDLAAGLPPAHAQKVAGFFDIRVLPYGNVSLSSLRADLVQRGYNLQPNIYNRKDEDTGFDLALVVRVAASGISQLADLPHVRFIEPIMPPNERDDERGNANHRGNWLNSPIAGGLKFDGSGVTITIADDGPVGPHIDFKGRLLHVDSVEVPGAINHGDMTVGCAVGGGNLNPRNAGNAPGAFMYYYNIDNYQHITDAIPNQANRGIYLSSTSYSQGCNTYTTLSNSIDAQTFASPKIYHSFSAGNANVAGGSCNTNGFNSITGGMKLGKNVIAVGNLTPDDVIVPSSSRGPSRDGRIKPDFSACGNGQLSTNANNTYQDAGGTSAASPSATGVAAQLFQAYKSLNNGEQPDAALIKSAMMNTAEDLGNVGPDYTFGWGRINGYRAYELLRNRRYVRDEVTSAAPTKTFRVNIPAGTAQVKIMTYWADPAGAPNSTLALVNDLDMRVLSGTDVLLPWTLRTGTIVDSLALPARRGLDRNNNSEQVVINAPTTGFVDVEVNGFSLPNNTAQFYVLYEFVKDEISVTYPNGKEGLLPSEITYIRWDAPRNSTATFLIESSINDGLSWSVVANGVSATARHYVWSTPPVTTSKARIRVTRNGQTDQSDATFTIAPTVSGIRVTNICPDSVILTWTPVVGATAYEVSKLGEKFMDSVVTTVSNIAKVAARSSERDWYSVRVILADGSKGLRANAIQRPQTALGCPASRDLEVVRMQNPIPSAVLPCRDETKQVLGVWMRNYGESTIESFKVSYKLNNGAAIEKTVVQTLRTFDSVLVVFPDTLRYNAVGNYTLLITAEMSGDVVRTNDTILRAFSVVSNRTSPIQETFEGTSFPPAGWNVYSSSTAFPWQRASVIGKNGQTTQAAAFDNFSYNNRTRQDVMETWVVDLAGLVDPILTFDRSYAYGTTIAGNDILRVDASLDCGRTFGLTGYARRGATLVTAPQAFGRWVPTSGTHWRSDTIDLTPYANQSVVMRFINTNGNGNVIYLDNINISRNLRTATENIALDLPMLKAYPNPSEQGIFNVQMRNFENQNVVLRVYDLAGKLISEKKAAQISADYSTEINLVSEAKGTYFLQVQNDSKTYVLKLVKL